MGFQEEVTRFYRAWDALERSLGPSAGLVLDFDMAPASGAVASYPGREAALDALVGLRRELPAVSGTLANADFVAAKLDGAEAYLRALLGERLPFAEYLRRTMGIEPAPTPPEERARLRAELEEAFGRRGISFAPEGRAAYARCFGSVDGSEIGEPLRRHARRFVGRVGALLGAMPDPEYTIEVVCEDAYWSNWIDGSADRGVLLRVNTHDRIEYNRFSAESLAAHEIAGHAVHVSSLRRSAEAGALDTCALNLAVHSCEAFQMEGLAQAALHVLSEPGELDEDLRLLERHRDYAGARMNDAQIAMEAGASLEEAVADTLRDCPLLRPISVESSLRDRARNPLYRSYIHVYAPARRLFARAAVLPEAPRAAFFRAAWTGLYTPDQLRDMLPA